LYLCYHLANHGPAKLEMHDLNRKVKILGTGKFLPEHRVCSTELDAHFNKPQGWTKARKGLNNKYVTRMSVLPSQMCAEAAKQALQAAQIEVDELDCIVSACGVMEQLIPCTAALVQKSLGLADSGIAAFDINSTCLSFVTALDVMAYPIAMGRYRRVLIVAADVGSTGLDPNDIETYPIFGDGAAAAIITPSDGQSAVLAARMLTYAQGSEFSQIKVGAGFPPVFYPERPLKETYFTMQGKALYRLVKQHMTCLVTELLAEARLTLQDIKLVIPHQASYLAMRGIREHLNLPAEKIMDIYAEHGNQIAASIPTALHEAIVQNKIARGDNVLLLGTSAGVSLGGLILRY